MAILFFTQQEIVLHKFEDIKKANWKLCQPRVKIMDIVFSDPNHFPAGLHCSLRLISFRLVSVFPVWSDYIRTEFECVHFMGREAWKI